MVANSRISTFHGQPCLWRTEAVPDIHLRQHPGTSPHPRDSRVLEPIEEPVCWWREDSDDCSRHLQEVRKLVSSCLPTRWRKIWRLRGFCALRNNICKAPSRNTPMPSRQATKRERLLDRKIPLGAHPWLQKSMCPRPSGTRYSSATPGYADAPRQQQQHKKPWAPVRSCPLKRSQPAALGRVRAGGCIPGTTIISGILKNGEMLAPCGQNSKRRDTEIDRRRARKLSERGFGKQELPGHGLSRCAVSPGDMRDTIFCPTAKKIKIQSRSTP